MRLHHGTLNAIILPHVLRFQPSGRVSRSIHGSAAPWGSNKAPTSPQTIDDLNRKIGLPTTLGALGVAEAHVPELVAHAVCPTSPAPLIRARSAKTIIANSLRWRSDKPAANDRKPCKFYVSAVQTSDEVCKTSASVLRRCRSATRIDLTAATERSRSSLTITYSYSSQ